MSRTHHFATATLAVAVLASPISADAGWGPGYGGGYYRGGPGFYGRPGYGYGYGRPGWGYGYGYRGYYGWGPGIVAGTIVGLGVAGAVLGGYYPPPPV